MGNKDHPLYKTWRRMRSRCNHPSEPHFDRYGGRGIKVCERWDDFYLFTMDMGPRPDGYSLDRIDNDGDYTPENCRWASTVAQANNRSSNRCLTYAGKTLTIAEWGRELGIKSGTIAQRLHRGWTVQRALGRQTKLISLTKNGLQIDRSVI